MCVNVKSSKVFERIFYLNKGNYNGHLMLEKTNKEFFDKKIIMLNTLKMFKKIVLLMKEKESIEFECEKSIIDNLGRIIRLKKGISCVYRGSIFNNEEKIAFSRWLLTDLLTEFGLENSFEEGIFKVSRNLEGKYNFAMFENANINQIAENSRLKTGVISAKCKTYQMKRFLKKQKETITK